MKNNGTQLSNILIVPSFSYCYSLREVNKCFLGWIHRNAPQREEILLPLVFFFSSMLLPGTQMWWLELLHPHCNHVRKAKNNMVSLILSQYQPSPTFDLTFL